MPIDSPVNGPVEESTDPTLLALLDQANQVATEVDLSALLEGILALSMQLCPSRAAVFYLLDSVSGELICRAVRGELTMPNRVGQSAIPDASMKAILEQGRPAWLNPTFQVAESNQTAGSFYSQKALMVPLVLADQPVGAAVLFDCTQPRSDLLEFLFRRMASEVYKSLQLELARQRNERLESMIAIFGQIGSTLDRDRILHLMIEFARQVINAEACSLFLVDEETGDMVLHLASNVNKEIQPVGLRVPAGKGIIGDVVQNGQIVLVSNAKQDRRHYAGVDRSTGFLTQSILAVPLRSRQVILGGERGSIQEKIIGGFEAINKINGFFNDEDARLLVTLANQAATVLQISSLYTDATDLFFDVISALTESIDAKDPYTQGHSQRVCEFSVEIARQLGLEPEIVHCIRIGSLLHDVGKIGIPDAILTKPERLTGQEYEVMKQHPTIGSRIMSQVRLLREELPAMAEHHERLDGGGYPKGLSGAAISLAGRIVAVADVFDALTSDRPYRSALTAEEAFEYLTRRVDQEFDRQCVEALIQSYLRGAIRTQKERELLG